MVKTKTRKPRKSNTDKRREYVADLISKLGDQMTLNERCLLLISSIRDDLKDENRKTLLIFLATIGVNVSEDQAQSIIDKCESIINTGKYHVGACYEHVNDMLLAKAGIYCIAQVPDVDGCKADLFISHSIHGEAPKVSCRISCKLKPRDKKQDGYEVYIYNEKTNHKFLRECAKTGAILIVIDPAQRAKEQFIADKHGISITLHDLDSGVDEMKRRYW